MAETVRVGVIGCGVGRGHARAYAALPNVELVALSDLEKSNCQPLINELGVPNFYRDYEELLAQPDIDAVSICVPNFLHAPMAIKALQAGKHVLVEKPLATSVEDGEAMAAAAQKADRLLMPVFNYRFRTDSQLFKQHIEAGNLGNIYFAKAGWMRSEGIPAGAGSWFIDKSRSGGGCLIDLGVHMLDLSLWLMGNPKVLSVNAATYAALGPQGRGFWKGSRFEGDLSGFNVEDFVSAFLRLENGTILALEVSWATYSHWGDDFFVHLLGNDGGGEMNIFNYSPKDTLSFFTDVKGKRQAKHPKTDDPSRKSAQHQFIQSIRQKTALSPTMDEGLQVLRIIDAIYRSSAEKREIDLI